VNRVAATISAGWLLATLAGCESYRVEYHTRPAYMMNAAGLQDNDEVTLEDGTKIVYSTRHASPTDVARTGGEPRSDRYRIRDETEDGEVELRALLPQHVLANMLTCLRNEEYELIYDQLLSDRTKREYEMRGQGPEQFEAFCATNRLELAATLTRMLLGLANGDAFMKNVGGSVVRFYFHPRIAPQFRYKTVEVIAEGGGLKLLMIK
jgi:hypothetical protein